MFFINSWRCRAVKREKIALLASRRGMCKVNYCQFWILCFLASFFILHHEGLILKIPPKICSIQHESQKKKSTCLIDHSSNTQFVSAQQAKKMHGQPLLTHVHLHLTAQCVYLCLWERVCAFVFMYLRISQHGVYHNIICVLARPAASNTEAWPPN